MTRETIDITPTWSALLPAMLDVVRSNPYNTDAVKTVTIEFQRMAQAADRWNEHMKAVHARNKRFGD